MPRHSPRRLRPARMRSPRGLSALIAIAMVTPAIALASGASPTKPVALPDCINFPAATMAGLLGVNAFVLKHREFPQPYDVCAWKTAHVPGRYSDLLDIEMSSGATRSFFALAKQNAEKQAVTDNGIVSSGVIPGALAAYRVVTITDSKSMPPCFPGRTIKDMEDVGPPTCEGQPSWEEVAVYAYGVLKPNGPTVDLVVSISGEPAVFVRGPGMVAAQILSGQIR